jgi:hypothetical protein
LFEPGPSFFASGNLSLVIIARHPATAAALATPGPNLISALSLTGPKSCCVAPTVKVSLATRMCPSNPEVTSFSMAVFGAARASIAGASLVPVPVPLAEGNCPYPEEHELKSYRTSTAV